MHYDLQFALGAAADRSLRRKPEPLAGRCQP